MLAFRPVFATNYDFGAYTEINQNESYGIGDVINVGGAATIVNHGAISGTLNVTDYGDLYVENTGTFNLASFNLGAGATITQVITTSNDITCLSGISSGYEVLVIDATDALNWNDIVSNTTGAGHYTLSASKIRLDNIVAIDDVKLENTVYVHTNNLPDTDVLVFSNVSGAGTVRAIYDGTDVLHSVEAYRLGSDVFIRVIRSNDYASIIGGDDGNFLDLLRQKSPNDKLLRRLDSVNTVDHLNRVMSKSAKLHPIKFMQSIKTMYSHKSLEIMHIDRDDNLGIIPLGIFSNDLVVFGVEPYATLNLFDDLQIKLSANVSSLKYADDINEYTGVSYGIGADAIYGLPNNNFVRVYGGLSFASFDTGIVFDGNDATTNPDGFSGYAIAEAGHSFLIDNDINLMPFVVSGINYSHIIKFDEYNFYAGTGIETKTSFDIDGMRYTYALRGLVRTDSAIGGGVNVSVWSISDAAGADFEFGILYDDALGASYHVSLNAKFNF